MNKYIKIMMSGMILLACFFLSALENGAEAAPPRMRVKLKIERQPTRDKGEEAKTFQDRRSGTVRPRAG